MAPDLLCDLCDLPPLYALGVASLLSSRETRLRQTEEELARSRIRVAELESLAGNLTRRLEDSLDVIRRQVAALALKP